MYNTIITRIFLMKEGKLWYQQVKQLQQLLQ